MTTQRALVTVVVWSVTFAILGGVVGAALGVTVPEYYRSIFRNGESPGFNPVQVGIGLGVTQGLAVGVLLSFAMVVLIMWRDRRG